jgi:hypothetical protein
MTELEAAAVEYAEADRDWRIVVLRHAEEWKQPQPDGYAARKLYELGHELFLRRERAQDKLLELGRQLLGRRAAA